MAYIDYNASLVEKAVRLCQMFACIEVGSGETVTPYLHQSLSLVVEKDGVFLAVEPRVNQ